MADRCLKGRDEQQFAHVIDAEPLANELLGVDEARRILIDFAHGEQPTAVYAWHDITDTFTKR